MTKPDGIAQHALVFVARRAWARTVQLDTPTGQGKLIEEVVLNQGSRKVSDRPVDVEIPRPEQLQVGRCGAGSLVSVHHEIRSEVPNDLRDGPGLG